MRIATLMTCHNRREITIKCLERLSLSSENSGKIQNAIFIVDDGSTDGTAKAITRNCQGVRVIQGDGTLYWAKSMRRAWEAAVAERDDWDGYLWLNDDTVLNDDAISRILAANNGERIVVGDLVDSKGKKVYGLREGGLFTGNCVYVPRIVYERLGMICGDYTHAWADSDYAMRAMRAVVEVVSAGVVGKTEGHPNRPPLKGLSLKERMKLLTHPKGWNVHDLWLYRRRNWGYVAAIFSCLHLIAHVVIGER